MFGPASQTWQPIGVVILAASTDRGTMKCVLKLTLRSVWLLLQTKHVPGPLFWQPVIVAAFAVSSRREERNGIITASFSVVIVEETYA